VNKKLSKKEYDRNRYLANPEKKRLHSREFYYFIKKDPEKIKIVKLRNTEAVRRWRKNNPEKVKAQRKVFSALRNKTLFKKPCEVCGSNLTQAHHGNYQDPLNINWLCKQHHMEADLERRELSTTSS